MERRVRDELAALARHEFGGVSLGEVVNHLLREHKVRRIMERYEQMRADPDEWADYRAELDEWDATVGDGLLDAENERPGRAS